MITAEYKRNLAKYEQKRREVHDQLEIEVRELTNISAQRDAAIHDRDIAFIEREKAEQILKNKKDEIVNLDTIIESKRRENEEYLKNAEVSRRNIQLSINNNREIEKNLILVINELIRKRDHYLDLIGNYDSLTSEVDDKKMELRELGLELENAEKQLKKITDKSDKITREALELKEKNEKEFAILQEARAGLDFYAERLRNWYHDKGLKLPEMFEVENITKQI